MGRIKVIKKVAPKAHGLIKTQRLINTLTESEVRELWNNIYNHNSDSIWEESKDYWMKPKNIQFLLNHQCEAGPLRGGGAAGCVRE